jgi:solute carrier family 24 (sodium/potassium/calcium exchanger), member 6
VADEHLSPSLQKISKTFKLSESLAGVTLLAFGAGAPDVFASLSASEEADIEGIQLGLAVLLGSSLFILAGVTATVLFGSPHDIVLNKWFFIRDSLFLMIAYIALIYATLYREIIDMPMAIAFVVLYGVYVVTVLVQDTYYKRNK